jgi:hypothetical protein
MKSLTRRVALLTGGIVGPHYAASKPGLHRLTHFLASRLASMTNQVVLLDVGIYPR